MHNVKVGEAILHTQDGQYLLKVLIDAGKVVDSPCGGRGTCGKCKVLVNGKEQLACQYEVKEDIEVVLPGWQEIASYSGAKESGVISGQMCYALDIGTTTLALALVSLDRKEIVKVVTKTNPQRVFGADIMSRIQYCTENTTHLPHTMLLEAVEEMIEELAEEIAQAATLPPLKLYVAANATMLHLLFDVDCSTIGVASYRAAFLEGKKVPSFIKGVSEIESLPSIHAFVGADIVAGMCRVGQPMEGKYHLLVDLGTNAEVVLFKKGRALATAAAAGPCFEGANITNGMSATRGAICAFRREAGKDVMQTIADAAPEGICGSGLIDLIAELVRAEEIDETGFLECEEYILCEGATESALQTEGVLQSEAKAEQKAGKRVALTVGDVRQFQLAKAAVCAAIETMLHIEQITEQEIETIYLSGGFSTSIDIDNAMEVGLLPKSMAGKCVAINNSSLQGCVKYALGECEPKDFLEGAEYVDLSTHAKFGELFIDRMGFEK